MADSIDTSYNELGSGTNLKALIDNAFIVGVDMMYRVGDSMVITTVEGDTITVALEGNK